MGWRKPHLESNHLNKAAYRYKRGKKNYCKSDDKHKEQQKDTHEDVKKRLQNHRMWGRKVRTSILLFLKKIMCLSLYDYQAKASRYREGKNRATTNRNQTIHSQKEKGDANIKRNPPTKKRKEQREM